MSLALNWLLEGMAGQEWRFLAGQTVFHLGNPVRHVHFVRHGIIHLLRYQSDGTALVLQRAAQGAMLAEASLYSDVYHCDACAQEAAVTFAVERDELRNRLDSSPQAAQALMQHFAQGLQRARLQAEILSLKTVKARLNAWLVWNGQLPPKGQWRRIASEIGVSPEALYREIAERG
ncbi:MAG: Crp/Fnr family transcriptional regulator [Hyphomicrobiales bacterium]|nr:Crp/Fnr family transcriptional regulator [Hyphomicrobiales bacterium]MDE2113420.1 Crp/Fnr family transcriptional regulator [Hyphomicrobiales bacterium]